MQKTGAEDPGQRPNEEHNSGVSVLYFFVDIFIKTFGITEPTERARKQAAFFILALIALSLIAATMTAFILRSLMQ